MAENTEEILDEDKMNNPGKDDEVEADNTADFSEGESFVTSFECIDDRNLSFVEFDFFNHTVIFLFGNFRFLTFLYIIIIS